MSSAAAGALTEMYQYEHPHPAVTTDSVVFTVLDGALKLLLIRRANPPFRDRWALPGGFVEPHENLDQAAGRELAEETGISNVYLEQLHAFGEPDRDPRGRVITIAYIALAPAAGLQTRPGSDAAGLGWFAVHELPELAFDHAEIIAVAQARLAAKFTDYLLALEFLPELFTLGELQDVCEAVLGRRLDKRNFRKHVLARPEIARTGECRRGRSHRPAALYRAIDRRPGQSAR